MSLRRLRLRVVAQASKNITLHTGDVPKTAHNKLLTPKKRTGNQFSAALVLLCRFCSLFPPAVLLAARALLRSSSVLFLGAFLAGRFALLASPSCAACPAGSFALGLGFFSGISTTPEPITFSGTPFASYWSGTRLDTQYWAGVRHRSVRSVAWYLCCFDILGLRISASETSRRRDTWSCAS